MKTRNIILVSVPCIVLLFLAALYSPAYLQCSEGLQWDLSCSFSDSSVPFDEFLKQKATTVFDMTLEKFRINSKQLTVQDGYKWDDEFFMAESIADDGNRYFLMTSFAQDASIDKIDVQIFKIISEKCTTGHIVSRQGCAPEYIQELKIPVPPPGIDYLLSVNGIDYLSDKLVVTGGPTFAGDPGCGAVIDVDSSIHWFNIDSISNPTKMTLYSENPHQCEVNTTSCFCNAQIDMTILTLDELSYFTENEEKEYVTILLKYIQNNVSMKNIEPKFRIGKLNLNFTDSTAIGYCGERPGNNRSNFFSGAIVNGYVKDYGLDKELSPLCAISDDAKWHSFD
jgi:hypothetical protein